MITLLGTSHVSTRSAKEVEQAVPNFDVIAIELDRGRAHSLMTGKRAGFGEIRKSLGTRAAIVASVLRFIQEKVAKHLDVVPGEEMKKALVESEKHKKTTALIDREIGITLSRLSKNIGWPEYKQMFKDLFSRRKLSVHPDDDLVAQLLLEMKNTYPRIYKVMVEERDIFMARQLIAIQNHFPDKNVLAVVGKGHIPGMIKQISYINAEIEVQVWNSPVPKEQP